MTARCILIISIILFSQVNSSAQENLSEVVDRIMASTVVILAYDDGGNVSQGSGFFINKSGMIITCLHVLKGFNRSEIKTSDGSIYPVKEVISKDIEGDLVCIRAEVPRNSVYPISLNPTIPKRGERVVTIGSPLGLEKSVSDGIVSAIRNLHGYGTVIQISAPISRGSSGGSVSNLKGEVIGVASFSAEGGQLINFAVPCERVSKLATGKVQSIGDWNSRGFSSAEEAFFKGINYVRDDDYETALPCFEKAIEIDSTYKDAYFFAGYCNNELGYSDLEKYKRAIEYFNETIERDAKNDDAWNNKGYAMLKLGRDNESIVLFDVALGLDPLNDLAWSNKGFALYNMSKYDESLGCLDKSLEINPFNARAWDNKGMVVADLGKVKESLNYFNQSIEVDESYAPAWNNMGFALFKLGRYNESLNYYDRALVLYEREKVRPSHALTWINKGQALAALKRYSEALDCFDRATELQPDNSEVWNNTGIDLFNLGRYDEALQCLEKATSLNPSHIEAWRYKALSLQALHRDAEAKKSFEVAEYLMEHSSVI